MYTVHCTVHIVHCTLYNVQCIPCDAHFVMLSKYSQKITFHTIHISIKLNIPINHPGYDCMMFNNGGNTILYQLKDYIPYVYKSWFIGIYVYSLLCIVIIHLQFIISEVKFSLSLKLC